MRTLLVLLTIATAQLAGCLGDDGSVDAAADGAETLRNGAQMLDGLEDDLAELSDTLAKDPTNASAPVPVWRVGDAWAVSSTTADGTTEEHTLVVTAANGASYTLATTSESMAVYDAVYDISYLGSISATNLGGAQGGSPVKFFDFPLAEGKTWSTQWDGLDVRLTAKVNPAVETPLGPRPGFDIVGMAGEEVHATYSYVPALRWWSQLAFPTQGFTLRVTAINTNWTGTVVTGVANEVLALSPAAPGAYPPANPFTVAEGQTSLLLTLITASQQQARAISLVDPSGKAVPMGEGQQDVMFDPQPRNEFTTAQLPATPGEWHLMMGAAHDPEGFLALTIHEIALTPVALG